MDNTQALTTREPDVLAMIDQAGNLADSTRTKYKRALTRYLATGADLGDAEALATYARDLPTSGRAFLKAALRVVTERTALALKGSADPDNVQGVQAALYRLDALQSAIEVETHKGTKAHTWLTAAEVKRLFQTCGDDLQGQRDRVILGLLAGAGLRRAEVAALTFDAIILQPVAGKMRTVLQVTGKGAKSRIVPVSDALANALDAWAGVTGGTGHIARAFTRRRELAGSISSVGIFHIVRAHGAQIGKPDLAPHDLRRTFAQLGLDAGVPIVQISTLLGHAGITTTQRYLNLAVDLSVTVSDFVPFA